MKRLLKLLASIILLALLIVGVYVAYVFGTYYRIEDKQELLISQFAKTEHLKPKTDYRITSFNIGFGAYSDDYSFFMDGGEYSRALSEKAVKENTKGSIQRIKDLKPAIALFQEVDVDGTRSYHVNQQTMIEKEFPDDSTVFAQNYDSPYLLYPFSSPHGKNKAGLLTLSNTQITSALRRSLPIEEGFTKFLDLDRCYSVNRIKVTGNKELVVYNVHLSAYTTDPTTADKQLEMLFKDMGAEAQKGNYCIAGGDFNKDLLGSSYEIFKQGSPAAGEWAKPLNTDLLPDNLVLVAPFDKENPVPSCRNADQPYSEDNFVITIDGFVVSKNVKVKKAFVDDAKFKTSDHNPVVLDFTLE